MTDRDSDGEIGVVTTRRRFNQALGMAAVPASHAPDVSFWDKLLGRDEKHAGTGENVYVRLDGEIITEDTKAIDFSGYAVQEVVEKNEHEDEGVVKITLDVDGEDISPESVTAEDGRITDLRQTGLPEPSRHQSDKRPFKSTQSRTLYVDPNGDDSGAGTQSDPLATLNEALARTPEYIQHQWTIQVNDGTYSGNVRSGMMHFVGRQPHDPSPFRIVGNQSTPSNVVFTDPVDLAIYSTNELDNGQVIGCTFEGGLENNGGAIRFLDCVLRDSGNMEAAFIGHNAGTTIFQNCSIEKPVTHGIRAQAGHQLYLTNCDIYTGGVGLLAKHGSTVKLADSTDVNGDWNGWEARGGAEIIDERGQSYRTDQPIMEDWGDNRLSNRLRPTAGYRPNWNIHSGSPTVENNTIKLSAGDTTLQAVKTESEMATGIWTFTFQLQSSPTAGGFTMTPMYVGSDDVFFRVRHNGAANLWVNGSAVLQKSWTVDQTERTAAVKRAQDIDGNGNAGYEIFVDGTSLGTHATDYVPDMTGTPQTKVENGFDAALHVPTILQQRFTTIA